MVVAVPLPPAVVVEGLSEGHQPRQLPARPGRAPVLGGAIAGLAARVLADHARSAAIMERDEPGADTDPAIWSRARLMLPALPFAIIAAIGVSRIVIGPGWGLLPLLAVGPAGAAAARGPPSTPGPGAGAPAGCGPV